MSLRQDLVPSDWKMDCVTPIFKNYWSISLTSLVGYGNEDLRTPSPLIAIIRLRVALRERLADGDRAGRKHSRHRCPGGRTVIGAGFGDVWWWHGAAVVLWWRVLGLLRDPSDVASPQNLAQILKHFSELMETPVKLSNNYQSISPDTQSSPEPPELILPHTHGGSLLLQGGGQRAGGRVWACNWLLLAGSAGVVSTHPGLHLCHQHRHHLHRCQSSYLDMGGSSAPESSWSSSSELILAS
ncbi:ral GTPase-activating protein subunit alpha-2-like isoform X1 [Eriocheir sinensis]|uniref:ral GTPase-activating protein subunit alpha-2-like isoform X1 n=1 Tax=Eriocheir sinensis TaxID=95602 RepID=UPI0021C5AA7A|nr:ral GTPase-activating protein subunit alpha-2-like isoform X1 [Eriocheir sinensis]